ncbi:MAG: exodeoxyribonuclease VII small subunit [Provencibacterium sp.]|jgi:exodeoxyribonuclease VII small subunit|nr:exodeoxyribonuclease VII small subunit [Provencibacterium sp.]
MKKKDESFSLEEALAELEKISEKMAAEDLPIEESLGLYEKSVKLVALCQESLKKARLKIVSLEKGEEAQKPSAEEAADSPAV